MILERGFLSKANQPRDTPQHKREDSNLIKSATRPFVVRIKRTST